MRARAGRQNPTISLPRPGISIIFMSKRKIWNNFLVEIENQQIDVSPSRKYAKHVVPSPEKTNNDHHHSLKIVKSWEILKKREKLCKRGEEGRKKGEEAKREGSDQGGSDQIPPPPPLLSRYWPVLAGSLVGELVRWGGRLVGGLAGSRFGWLSGWLALFWLCAGWLSAG